MSRSVKKTPGFTDRNPFMKAYANKRVRAVATRVLRNQYVTEVSYETLVDECVDYWGHHRLHRVYYEVPYDSFYNPELEPSHSNYKRYTCPWDICDWKWLYWSTQEITEYCDRWGSLAHKLYSK